MFLSCCWSKLEHWGVCFLSLRAFPHWLSCLVLFFSHTPAHQIAPAKAQSLLPLSPPCVHLHLHALSLNVNVTLRRHLEQSPMSRCFGNGSIPLQEKGLDQIDGDLDTEPWPPSRTLWSTVDLFYTLTPKAKLQSTTSESLENLRTLIYGTLKMSWWWG